MIGAGVVVLVLAASAARGEPALGGTLTVSSAPAATVATVSATPAPLPGAAGSATALAVAPAPAGTLAGVSASATAAVAATGGTSFIESLTQIQVRRMYLPGTEQVGITIPDGEARLLIENRFAGSVYRVGGHYNIVTGRIEASFTDAIQVLRDGTQLQVAVSDDIGLGPLYYKQHAIERTQSFPIGLGRSIGIGNLMVTAQRARWKYGELDPPSIGEQGLIDSVGVLFSASDLIPDLAESQLPEHQRHEHTTIKFQHAFRGLGGDYQYDKLESDVRAKLPGLRQADAVELRWLYGQATKIFPSLPLRETFGLGGADALRGYLFEEFRGNGLSVFSGEYAFSMPWSFTIRKAKLFFQETSLLVFAEAGRIQDDWWRPVTPEKWSAGFGFRCNGQVVNSVRSRFRVYVAQAGEYPERKPIAYLVADVD